MNLLFWNLNGRPLARMLHNLVAEYHIDILVVTECTIAPAALTEVLDHHSGYPLVPSYSILKDTHVYAPAFWQRPRARYEDESMRLSIQRLWCPSGSDILLVVAHLPSRVHMREASLSQLCMRLGQKVRDVERQEGHSRTLLVADLNADPFDEGVVSPHGLHATMSRFVASRRERVVLGETYPFFFNPMWSRFGDVGGEPPGTYYYRSSEPAAYFWHVFDQILVRPDLMDYLPADCVRIITSDGSSSLLTARGLPARRLASDHLPIMIMVDL